MRPGRAWGVALAGAAAAIAMLGVCAGPAQASGGSVLSPLAIQPLDPADPVRAADGRMHLAYELDFANRSQVDVTIERIETLTGERPIGEPLEGAALAARMRLNRPGPGPATIAGGSGATAFMDVTYAPGRRPPSELRHRFTLSFDSGGGVETLTFTGVPERVRDSRPVRLEEPPLRGGRWLAASACCTLNPHRGATLSIDGTTHVPERFAIDWVQLDDQLRLFEGPRDELSSYAFYGEPVRAAVDGKVVRARDGLPEQVPGELPAGATIQNAGGNHVVTKVAGRKDRFAFYAHLQTESVRVRRGDRVRAGDVLGLLGNTGNTDAPHLHFHVMDGPDPLQSNGLPNVIPSFRGQGVVTNSEAVFAGAPTELDPALLGRHRDEFPLDNQLVGLGG
jgi:hypothetical protein